ncbi:MAG: hypothetical protein Q8M07_32670 [Prosthecobacter sp.]|nr:hypothetical protein [Prosthecobacter sp.]
MSPLKTFFNPWLTLMGSFTESFSAPPLERASDAFASWTQFTILRCKEDLELGRRLALCRTPVEVQRAYIDFWKTGFEQYGEYYAHLMQDAQPLPRPKEQPNVHERQRHRAAA